MSCASGPRGWRWRRWLTRRGPRARSAGSARSWVSTLRLYGPGSRRPQAAVGLRPGTTTDEAQRIKELEKEVRELRRANAILKSASACLSRRSVSARPADLQYIAIKKEEFGAWPICKVLTGAGVKIAPST